MNNLVRVNVDYAHNEKIQDVLMMLKKHRGKVVDFNPEGPGGGNPCMTVQFESEVDGVKYLLERYPDDSESFSKSRLGKVP